MSVLAGLTLVVGPEGSLGPRERRALRGLGSTRPAEPGAPVLKVSLEPRASRSAAPPAGAPEPAQVAWSGERLVLSHACFDAVIDAAASAAVVRREPDDPTGRVTTLRMALSARLPLEGGLLLHAAALASNGRGFVFFGPSGIGKSTLAERSPWEVIADELAVVLPHREPGPRRVTGVALSEESPAGRTASEHSLACLIELAQGPRFHLERLDRATALRRLLGSIVVPPGPPLWSAALEVAGELVRETPCYRMEWSLDASPFELLEATLT